MKLRIWCPLCPDKKASNGKKRKGDVKSDVSEKDVRQRYQQHFYSLHKAQYPNEKYPGAIPPVWSWNDAKGEWHKDDDGREGGVYVEPPTARQVLADCRLLGETLPAWAEHAWYTNRPDDRDPALARPPAPAPQHPPPTPAAPTPAAAPPPAVSAPAPPPTPATAPGPPPTPAGPTPVKSESDEYSEVDYAAAPDQTSDHQRRAWAKTRANFKKSNFSKKPPDASEPPAAGPPPVDASAIASGAQQVFDSGEAWKSSAAGAEAFGRLSEYDQITSWMRPPGMPSMMPPTGPPMTKEQFLAAKEFRPKVSAPAPPPTPATAPDARKPFRTCEYGLMQQHQLLKLLRKKTLYLGNVPPWERKETLELYQLMKDNSKLYKLMKQYQRMKQHHQHQAAPASPQAAPLFRIVAKRKALPSLAAAAPPPPLADDPPGYDHNASFSDAAEIENSVEQYLGPRPQPTSQLRQNSVDVLTQTEPQSADPRFQKPPAGWADADDSLLGATPKASLVFSAKRRALPMPNPAPPAAGAPPPDVIGVNRELDRRDVKDLCSIESSTSATSSSSSSTGTASSLITRSTTGGTIMPPAPPAPPPAAPSSSTSSSTPTVHAPDGTIIDRTPDGRFSRSRLPALAEAVPAPPLPSCSALPAWPRHGHAVLPCWTAPLQVPVLGGPGWIHGWRCPDTPLEVSFRKRKRHDLKQILAQIEVEIDLRPYSRYRKRCIQEIGKDAFKR